MGLALFNSDVAQAKSANIPKVSDLKRGDAGELSFTYCHGALPGPLLIHMIAHDATSYPENAGFIAFAESDVDVGDLASCLETACARRKWTDVLGAVSAICEAVTLNLEGEADVTFGDEEDDCSSTWSDDQYQMLEPMELSSQAGDPLAVDDLDDPSQRLTRQQSLQSLKQALRKAQAAGLVVGIYPAPGTTTPEIVSLSFPVSKLGVPAAVLQAWGLKTTDNLILLMRMAEEYPSTAQFLQLSSRQTVLEFRFGSCANEKPTPASVYSVYTESRPQSWVDIAESEFRNSEDNTENPFQVIHMSACIDRILNSDLMKLVSIRRGTTKGWDEAQSILSELALHAFSRPPASIVCGNDQLMEDIDVQTADESPVEPLAENDEVHTEQLGIPLIAMQFALRRLANCTKYCMVCSCRLQENLEALKPYICGNDLCLFQFLSLGLGSSIEHEIINAPYVVDMLICFLYSALAANTARELPTGLHIKGACLGSSAAQNTRFTAEANFQLNKIRLIEPLPGWCTFREGDHFVFSTLRKTNPASSVLTLNRGWCRVICEENSIFNFECFNTESSTVSEDIQTSRGYPINHVSKEEVCDEVWESVSIFGYWCDLDTLPRNEQSACLNTILDGLPSVLEMRDYLTSKPGRRLSKWGRINSPALSVLNWTVASNRSLIVQDDTVPANDGPSPNWTVASNRPLTVQGDTVSTNVRPRVEEPWTKVQGIGQGWMQFRFLQGSPEKERLFEAEVSRLRQSPSAPNKPPTIFAWHGSRFKNWHSIIRTGLDFKNIENGRASGNGVYFSNQMSTSLGYSRGMGYAAPFNTTQKFHWSQSSLNPTEAISICELINESLRFVSRHPHYVVDQLTWIQCRYLLLKVSATPEAIDRPFYHTIPSSTPGFVKQDDLQPIKGDGGQAIQIPVLALPRARQDQSRDENMTSHINEAVQAVDADSRLVSAKRQYEVDDVSLFLGNEPDEDDDMVLLGSRKRRSSQVATVGQQSIADNARARPVSVISISSTESAPEASPDRATFDPAKLDFASLRILPPPEWAAVSRPALRRITMDIKELHEKQSQRSTEVVGYHVHTEQTDNLFQWIVQLHSFDSDLPLAKDMERDGCSSIVLELRFGPSYPLSPPFVRVIRPRFIPFMEGGGGHVTQGGAMCLELLTTNGWNPAIHIDNVLTQIRAALCETERPARLAQRHAGTDYAAGEAAAAFVRLAMAHGWGIPDDFKKITETV